MTTSSTHVVRHRQGKWACASWRTAIRLANDRALVYGRRQSVHLNREHGMWVVCEVDA